MPFAIVSSEDEVEIDGQPVRARIYPWGIVEVDNPKHSDFSRLRGALLGYDICCCGKTVADKRFSEHICLTSRRLRTMCSMRHTVLRSCPGLFTPQRLSTFKPQLCSKLD